MSNESERISRHKNYPLADRPGCSVTRRHIRAAWTGEKRAPRKGEWYLSGSHIAAYQAPKDLHTRYHIAKLVRIEVVTTEKRTPLTDEDLRD